MLADPSCNATTWWKVARALCGFDKRSTTTEIPPLQTDIGHQKVTVNDQEKADFLNDVSVNQTTSLLHDATSFPCGPITVCSNFSIQHVIAIDVRKVVSRLPNKLSTGHDGISYRLLEETGPGLALPLTTMFNRCHFVKCHRNGKRPLCLQFSKAARKIDHCRPATARLR